LPPTCASAGRPAGIVGSVFQCRSFVELFEENQPLGGFLVGRRNEETIKIVHAEVTNDLFAAVTRHAHSTTTTLITSPTYYRGLLDELSEYIIDNILRIGEKPLNCISRWRFIDTAVVPDKAVLKFSGNWKCAVVILVIVVQEATKVVSWLVNSCSTLLRGGEHVVVPQKSNERCSNSGTVLIAVTFKNSSNRATACRALVLLDTVSKPCSPSWEASMTLSTQATSLIAPVMGGMYATLASVT